MALLIEQKEYGASWLQRNYSMDSNWFITKNLALRDIQNGREVGQKEHIGTSTALFWESVTWIRQLFECQLMSFISSVLVPRYNSTEFRNSSSDCRHDHQEEDKAPMKESNEV
jgi:hypothetical protein